MTDWKSAFDGRLQPGTKPALLLVDPVAAYVEEGSPLLLDTGAETVERMAEVLEEFRKRDLPVAWTGVRYLPDGSDGGQFFRKIPALKVFVGDNPLGQFAPGLTAHDDEAIFIKQYPSAFFGTSLYDWLSARSVDTLYIVGFSTSGCVRASALDALQHGFVPLLVDDACGDRNEDLHSQNLRDLKAKYAEVLGSADVAGALDTGTLP